MTSTGPSFSPWCAGIQQIQQRFSEWACYIYHGKYFLISMIVGITSALCQTEIISFLGPNYRHTFLLFHRCGSLGSFIQHDWAQRSGNCSEWRDVQLWVLFFLREWYRSVGWKNILYICIIIELFIKLLHPIAIWSYGPTIAQFKSAGRSG